MSFLGMSNSFLSGFFLMNLTVVAGTFSGEHVLLAVGRRVPCDVGAADVADRSLDALVDGNRFDPCSLVDDPDLLGFGEAV